MIRKLPSGKYRLYSRKTDPKTGKRRNLGTFASRQAAERHERAVQYFKRRGGGVAVQFLYARVAQRESDSGGGAWAISSDWTSARRPRSEF